MFRMVGIVAIGVVFAYIGVTELTEFHGRSNSDAGTVRENERRSTSVGLATDSFTFVRDNVRNLNSYSNHSVRLSLRHTG